MKPHELALVTFEERLLESERFHMATGKVHETLKTLAKDLHDEHIDHAIVGGMARNAHGYNRETVDINVLVRPEGLEAFRERLVDRGYSEKFAGARKAFKNTRTGIPVEFLTTGEFPGDGKPKPVAFPDPVEVSQDSFGVSVVNLPTLITLKLASGMTVPGRRRDLADVQDLIRVLHLDDSYADRPPPYVQPAFRMLLDELGNPDPHGEPPDMGE